MLYSEIIAVCSQIHTKHINALCGQNVECRTYRTVNTLCGQNVEMMDVKHKVTCLLINNGTSNVEYQNSFSCNIN